MNERRRVDLYNAALQGFTSAANLADSAVSALVKNLGGQGPLTKAALDSAYDRKRPFDPRDYGAVGDGVTDDTQAIQDAIDAAGATYPNAGVVELPPLPFKITSRLVLKSGTELRGTGCKTSRLMVSSDISAIYASGGQGQIIRNLKIWNTFTGYRTNWDIDIWGPTKPVIEDVEIDNQVTKTGYAGGVRFLGVEGFNNFMPQISRLWIRQGTLTIDGVTDGHFTDGFVWAADDNLAAIHVKSSGLWTFASVDVVPSDGGGSGYLIEDTKGVQIVGGYNDGSFSSNITGYGLRAVGSSRVLVTGHHFYHNGRSAVQLENSNACSFSSCGFNIGNKQNNFYPDINLVNSDHNVFLGNAHSQTINRTNKGGIYREDVLSLHNSIDYATVDRAIDEYGVYFQGNYLTPGDSNKPLVLWTAHAGAPDIIHPPATLYGIGSASAWPSVNMALFHRFSVSRGAPYRFCNFRVDVGSGNIQSAVVRLSGSKYTDYTVVMDSGIVSGTAGDRLLDMDTIYLTPGEYALAVWCDNTTLTSRINSNTGLTATRSSAEVVLVGGIPSSGSVGANWGSTRCLGGLSLGLTV